MKTDVVIIGGGPAGCSAALALAKLGVDSAIISAPKTTIKPTETALPSLAGLLQFLGADSVLAACEPCYGICSGWGRPESVLRPSIIDPHGHPWFIHRERFDSALHEAVLKAGSLWFEGAAESVKFGESGVTVITEKRHIQAKWLIVATGSPAWTARVTRQTITKHDSLTAFWGKLPEVQTERFLFLEPSEFGWWYLLPADGFGSIACLMTDPSLARSLGAAKASKWNSLFQETKLALRFGKAAVASQVSVASTGLMSLKKTQGDRWIAIGDAAVKLDPLGSGGTMTAMDAGRRAARAVFGCLSGRTLEFQAYGQWVTRLIGEFSRQRDQHYGLEYGNRSGCFWKRRQRMGRGVLIS